MRQRARALLLAAALLPAGIAGAQPAPARDAFLQLLAGSWVLRDGWLCFTSIDHGVPPAYQAAVYLGFDAGSGDYVAHRLDQFGAAGARVVAAGHRDGQRLVLTFPYPEGAFRDTVTLEPGAARGTLLLES
jgi:hypothetical protein